jgi:transposase InsO family protein
MATELMMTLKEADRSAVVKRIENKELGVGNGARELGISSRQMKRVLRRYKEKGAAGLLSLKKGKPSPNRVPNILRKKALSLVRKKYWDYGPTLAAEKLREKHGLKLSKETLRQLMIADGLWKEKKQKEKKSHPRRTRRSRLGDMIQIDGSYEFWFEHRGEKCCLIVFVDDATSRIMLMRFCRTETSEDYLKMLRVYIERYGRPLALYSDKHSIFRVNKKELHEEGKWTTRFHEVLKELNIELICAHSPQAKGRVERANGTLQDRLIKELREREICSMEEGNHFLDEYAEVYNRKFSVAPSSPEDAHQSILPSQKLEQMFMLKEERTLSKDLSFQYKNELYQIEANRRHSLCGKKVEVFSSDGTVRMILQEGKPLKYHKWKEMAAEPARIVGVKELEIKWSDKKTRKPSRDHPWGWKPYRRSSHRKY